MKRIFITTLVIIITICFTQTSFAQLSGSRTVGSGGNYTTLTGAGGLFADINSQGLSGNLTVTITSNLAETGANNLNQWTEVGAGGYTVTISPSSTTERVISGTVNGPMIRFAGADRVTIDGRFSGSGQYLRFRNIHTSGQTFRFVNDASNNTLTYLHIEGCNNLGTTGTITLDTTNTTNGNDNNTISFCDIRDRSDASGTPVLAIFSSGSTTASSRYNSNNTISNNRIYNFYGNGSNAAGIYLPTGNTDWAISDNSFYQTAARNNTSASGVNVIFITGANANNFTITGNFIGGTAANCGGTAWTITGAVQNFLYGIRLTGGTIASSIQGNTVRNINFTTQTAANGTALFQPILLQSGLINVGNITGNVIGDLTSTGNISITLNGTNTTQFIRMISHSGTGDLSNNTIGSVSVSGNLNQNYRFEAIAYQTTITSATNISNNTVGSSSVPNSIQSASTLSCVFNGMALNINGAGIDLIVNANSLNNLTMSNGSSASRLRGIYQTDGNTTRTTFSNNIISELVSASTGTTVGSATSPVNAAVCGLIAGSNDIQQFITGNIIRGMRATGNASTCAMGFAHTQRGGKAVFSKNKIYDITNTSTAGTPRIMGINAYWGSWYYVSNQISITNGESSDYHNNTQFTDEPAGNNNIPNHNTDVYKPVSSNDVSVITQKEAESFIDKTGKPETEYETDASTNGVYIEAVHDEAELICYYYYNTVYVGGSAASGANNTYCYLRPLSSWPTPVNFRNNLFYNGRTGGTGSHVSIGNEIAPPTTNWTATSSNYNVFISSNAATVGTWGFGVNQSISQWRTSSGGDRLTWSTLSSDITQANLFTNVAAGNLNINSGNAAAWIVSGKGLAISGQNFDIDNEARSNGVNTGCTDIGADEFTATPPSNPNVNFDNAPGSGVTTTYSMWNRTIAVVEWGVGGSSYPTAVNLKYFSGVTHPNAVTGNFANSYWDFAVTGTLTGAAYDVTIYFGDNETYTIVSPNTNTRLAKFETTWEVFTIAGSGNYQTELNWPNFTAKTRGPNTFSQYTLTDGNSPLPVVLTYFNGVAQGRNANLAWGTASEINNSGFDIERRNVNADNSYSQWEKIAFVQGHGTTNEEQNYTYKDSKLNSGKYQYRLKQIDYNSNHEYFTLNSPASLVIGNPVAFDMSQNYPNPSNPVTKIDYQIPFAGKVSLKVYDVTGKLVASLIDAYQDEGFYTAHFSGANLSSGVYFYRITAEGNGQNFNKTMKMILVK